MISTLYNNNNNNDNNKKNGDAAPLRTRRALQATDRLARYKTAQDHEKVRTREAIESLPLIFAPPLAEGPTASRDKRRREGAGAGDGGARALASES